MVVEGLTEDFGVGGGASSSSSSSTSIDLVVMGFALAFVMVRDIECQVLEQAHYETL